MLKKLVLVLEYPRSVGDQLRSFFETGDVSHFGIELQGRTINTLEFFHDLRRLHVRCEAMASETSIHLEVFCPEHDYPLDLSLEERGRLALNDRDDRTAENVLAHLEQRPDHTFLAYYGLGHIAGGGPPDARTTPWGLQIRKHGIDVSAVALLGFGNRMRRLPTWKLCRV